MSQALRAKISDRVRRGDGRFAGRHDGNPYSECPEWIDELVKEDVASEVFKNPGIKGRKYYALLVFSVVTIVFEVSERTGLPTGLKVFLDILLALVSIFIFLVLLLDWVVYSDFDEEKKREQAFKERRVAAIEEWELQREAYFARRRSEYLPKGKLEELLRSHEVVEPDSILDPELADVLIQNVKQGLPPDYSGGTSAANATFWLAAADIAELMLNTSRPDGSDPSIPERYQLRDLTDAVMELIDASLGAESVHSQIDQTKALEVIERAVVATGETLGSLASWQRHHPAPQPQPYGVSPEGAEIWVRDWMLHMGARNAEVTRLSGDGGLDVVSERFVAQVKLYSSPVPVSALRELAGVATFDAQRRAALFFTSSGYSEGGIDFANTASIALFVFDLASGAVTGANALGSHYVSVGFQTSS